MRKKQKYCWQKNGGQKNGEGKYCGGHSSALEVAIASGARPFPGIQCQNRKKQGWGNHIFFRLFWLFSANLKKPVRFW
jgi:hypothetical protein